MKTSSVCFVLLLAYAAPLLGRALSATYYASPQGRGDGASADTPFVVSRFWEKAQPGDTLVLLDGVYTGPDAMINPPGGLHGTPAAPITIRAGNDSKATLDGQTRNNPVLLRENDWFVVEGINAHHAKATVVEVSRSSHCVVRRVCGWDAADGNTNVFAAHDGWFENCAAIIEEGAAATRPFRLSNTDGKGLTAVGGSQPRIRRGDVADVLVAAHDERGRAAWKAIFRPQPPKRGAHIYYCYENGKLTDRPLWPWPMNERIKQLAGIDVTATVFGLGEQ